MMEYAKVLGTVAENIRFVCEKQNTLSLLRESQIAEIARVMAESAVEKGDWEEKRHIWQETMQLLDDPSLAVPLTEQYYRALLLQGDAEVLPKDIPHPVGICYLRNRGSDGAFDHITAGIQNVRAMYASGHEEALENCYDEYSDACILPYSDPERGLHMGFRTMISRYGLKINAMVQVENREGTAMDYVLLRREIAAPKGDAYLAVTVPISEGSALMELLSAAVSYGLSAKDVTKLPDQFSATPSYDFHFMGSTEAIETYLFYLTLNHPRFDLLGVYQKERETI